jgi:hypothetical protein
MPNSQAVQTTDTLEIFMSFPRENQKFLATNFRAKKKKKTRTKGNFLFFFFFFFLSSAPTL